MKLFFFVFVTVAMFVQLAFGLGESGESSYSVLPGRVCDARTRECCRKSSSCSLRYQASGLWTTSQDRTATREACNAVCGVHFSKCEEMCSCVSRQAEVQSGKQCKCTLARDRIFVRNSCIRICHDARTVCEKNCFTKRCPLVAETRMKWSAEFDGRCNPICEREIPISTVCTL